MSTGETGQQAKIKQKQGSGQGPIDITCPVNLTVDVLVCVWYVLVVLDDADVVVVDALLGGHAEVANGSSNGDHGGNDVVETAALGNVSNCCLY